MKKKIKASNLDQTALFTLTVHTNVLNSVFILSLYTHGTVNPGDTILDHDLQNDFMLD